MMTTDSPIAGGRRTKVLTSLVMFLVGLLLSIPTLAMDLMVVDGNGAAVSTPLRWMLEEDNTALTDPANPSNDTASLVIHKSHAPVVGSGSGTLPGGGGTLTVPIPDATKRYMLSVMADGYALGGANIAAGQTSATVVLNQHPIPTSQISVLVFHDNNPINNAPDALEAGLPGFRVILADIGGGPILQDAFGNPLGTTYQFDPNNNGEPIMVGGSPVVDQLGDGNIYTDANGKALIKYLAMGKYGVQVIPPTGTDWNGGHGKVNVNGSWHQTATIEGTLTVDAWVKANEPTIFLEGFGPGFYHVFFGFVDPAKLPWADPIQAPPPSPASQTVTGVVRYNHFGRPPNNQLFAIGPAVPDGWVGLNELNALGLPGRGLFAAPCDPGTGEFSIPNVPPGTYQLVTWDKPLDALFGFRTITVVNNPNDINNLGDVLVYRWFGTLEGSIFYDDGAGDPTKAENGFKDTNEQGLLNMVVNIRFRDGTVYQSTVSDGEGDYAFNEVFPFFKWLVTEVDYSRFKPTGMTTVIDEGGVIQPDNGWIMPSEGVRNPQPQYETDPITGEVLLPLVPIPNPNTGNNLSRTETGPVLTEAMHLFLNQNNRIDWGKINYAPGENGGISGVVGYQTTRAENDPRDAVIDAWEPGIPRVQLALYLDVDHDKIIDDINGVSGLQIADVDNYPFGFSQGELPGPEDIDRDSDNVFDAGDAVQIAWSDSWDDNMPAGSIQVDPPVIDGKAIIGSDNYATWNQVRPGLFDGGYFFGDYFPAGIPAQMFDGNPGNDPVPSVLPPGDYIVQAFPPPNYLIQTEESKNVDFGDAYKPSKLLLMPELVGTPANGAPAHIVPAYLTLFPGQQIEAPFAGQQRPLADRKLVTLAAGKNAACDFHMYTEVPKATRVVGFVLNDLSAEFNAFSPIFGEKASPGYLPISFRDWAGNEVARVYSDAYGTYNALVPSTYTVNVPSPSGVAPNMLTLILNDPTMPDPGDRTRRIADPYYNPSFATSPWTLHYYPGSLSYLDTPIVPIAGFVGYPNKQVEAEPPAGTPVIKEVSTTAGVGPYLQFQTDVITIKSMGLTAVSNPDYDPVVGGQPTVLRDYGFGTQGLGSQATIDGVPLIISTWADDQITATLPPVGTRPPGNEWQLMITRDNGGGGTATSLIGLTLTFDGPGTVWRVAPRAATTADPLPDPIQEAIDAAAPGDLIIVGPGNYYENPIMYKALRLQGVGAATVIRANPVPFERVAAWHTKVQSILAGGDPFVANENPGVLVLGQNATDFLDHAARVDGFEMTGSISGGGVLVYNFAHSLKISNNRLTGNQGLTGGGISLGLQAAVPGAVGMLYDNQDVLITYNQIIKNGSVDGSGGISLVNGAEGYRIVKNHIVGNFSRLSGGGIGHYGRNRGGLIANNTIAFNEVFLALATGGDGGGIYIAGEIAPGGLSGGAGSVTIINNLIQGNLAGSGMGGGIRVNGFNGSDVTASPGDPSAWYTLDIFNNMIVNNGAGLSGGGISLQDATRVRIVHNTIARNDCSATAQSAFGGGTDSTPRPAGIVAYTHSQALATAAGEIHSNPELLNNIIFGNRSFWFNGTTQQLVPDPAGAGPWTYWDLAVSDEPLPQVYNLSPTYCVLTDANGYDASNFTADPAFVNPYFNAVYAAAVIDEAGNNISVRLAPARPTGDYHLQPTSPARNNSVLFPEIAYDFDAQGRPEGAFGDIGADEVAATPVALVWPAVPLVGPPAAGAAPGGPVVPPVGPGVPPPVINPTPIESVNGVYLSDPEPLIDTDGDSIPDNDIAYYRLTAGDGFATMADGTVLYTFGFADASNVLEKDVMAAGALMANFAAPTLVFKEGQHVHLDLSNVGMLMRPDLFDPHTVHFHGFPQAATIFDGEPMASLSVNMGRTFRYYYYIAEPGTFLYHCHVEATEHMEMGMIGNLYVLPKQNNLPNGTPLGPSFTHVTGNKYLYNDGDGSTLYHVDFPLQLLGFDRKFHQEHIAVQPLPFATLHEDYPMINGRGYPDTINPDPIVTTILDDNNQVSFQNESQKVSSTITAVKGQRIALRISNVSLSDFHTLSVPGIPMTVVGKDARLLRGPTGKNLFYQTTSVTLGGGETADVILDTASVPAGTYFVYDARLTNLSNDLEDYGGMMTEIILTNP